MSLKIPKYSHVPCPTFPLGEKNGLALNIEDQLNKALTKPQLNAWSFYTRIHIE